MRDVTGTTARPDELTNMFDQVLEIAAAELEILSAIQSVEGYAHWDANLLTATHFFLEMDHFGRRKN